MPFFDGARDLLAGGADLPRGICELARTPAELRCRGREAADEVLELGAACAGRIACRPSSAT
jgi:hypothetical protein